MEVFYMATTNLNIYTDQKEEIFNELEIPNDTTAAAIEEGRKIMNDPSTPRYSSIEALKKALDV
jgi:archaellum component FlaG (FlaF/FlaG flagellin family)